MKNQNTIGHVCLLKTERAAMDAFKLGQSVFHIYGMVMRIVHAHTNFFQVVTPDGSEIFRIVSRPSGNSIMRV